MNTIQQARDVLKKWRSESQASDPQPWKATEPWPMEADVVDADGAPVRSDGSYAEDAGTMAVPTARLIVGTAGNPDLLDALDGMLARAAGQFDRGYQGGWNDEMARIAAAIIAQDERMTT